MRSALDQRLGALQERVSVDRLGQDQVSPGAIGAVKHGMLRFAGGDENRQGPRLIVVPQDPAQIVSVEERQAQLRQDQRWCVRQCLDECIASIDRFDDTGTCELEDRPVPN